MILVNSPGSWAHIHPPLRHAEWHGLTPTDLVFPFFLFIVGVAISLSFARRLDDGATSSDLVGKIVSRSLIIFAVGPFLNGFPFNIPLEELRIPGVLQRIALCYLLAGLAVVLTKRNRNRALVTAGFLVMYELMMRLPLVQDWGAGSFEIQDNFVLWTDLQLLGEAHIYQEGGVVFDPEGLVSTLTAAATTMVGFFVGEYIRGPLSLALKLRRLALVGAGLAAIGLLTCQLEPVNKKLWTVSYVLLTGGLAMFALAFSSWMIDVRKWRAGTLPAVVFGSNPLVAFVGSGLLVRVLLQVRTTDAQGQAVSLSRAMYEGFFVPLAGPLNGSLLYAVTTVIFWLGILWILHWRKLFIKI